MRPPEFKSEAVLEADRMAEKANEAFEALKAKAAGMRAADKFKNGREKVEWIRKEWAKMCKKEYQPRRDPWGAIPTGMTARATESEPDDDHLGRVGRAEPEKLPPTHAEKKAVANG